MEKARRYGESRTDDADATVPIVISGAATSAILQAEHVRTPYRGKLRSCWDSFVSLSFILDL